MNINRLNEFITLATLLNYSKAANQLYLTQPALSRHIHDLEQTVGAPLFIRDTHNVQLTPVGEVFLEEAKDLIEKYNHALDHVHNLSSLTTGDLKVGFLGTATEWYMSDFMMNFINKYPHMNIVMHSDNLDTLARELNDNLIDLSIVTFIDKEFSNAYDSKIISTCHLFAMVHPTSPFASRKSISMAELNGVPYINFPAVSHPLAADFNKQMFKKAGVEMNLVAEVPNIESAILQVNANKGVFFVPRYLVHLFKNAVAVPISDDFCQIKVNLVWKKKNQNPSIDIFNKEFDIFIQEKHKEFQEE